MSEPHILSNLPAPDLAELAGLLVEQEAAHRRARAGQDIALYTPGGDGHPAFEAACADMLSREEDATVADRAVVEMVRRLAARPAPVDVPTSTASSDFDALAGRIEAMADKLHRESRGDCRERDIARALSGMVYSARRGRLKPAPVEPDGLLSDGELSEASGRGWAEATLDGGDQEARANRAVANLAATRARAAWEAERARLTAQVESWKNEATRHQWDPMSDPMLGHGDPLVDPQAAKIAALTAQVESLTARLAVPEDVQSSSVRTSGVDGK